MKDTIGHQDLIDKIHQANKTRYDYNLTIMKSPKPARQPV
jgi:hypothetical protein